VALSFENGIEGERKLLRSDVSPRAYVRLLRIGKNIA
jgi:hypothetical protein